MKLTLENTQKALVTVTAIPPTAKFDGPPVWTNVNPSCGTLQVAPDGFSATYVTVDGVPVDTIDTVSIKGDADLGAGVVTIEVDFDVEITGVQATGFGVVFAPPVAK